MRRVRDRGYAYSVLVGSLDGKKPLGRPRRIWENIIKTHLKKWDEKTWTELFWLSIGAGDRPL